MMKNLRYILLVLIIISASCAPKAGVYHTVKKGQTLWRISKTYGVDMQLIAEYNEIYDPNLIFIGQELFIPGANRRLEVKVYTGVEEETGEIIVNKGMFSWPTDGVVFSLFGIRWGRMHKGIDISGEMNNPVRASKEGRVFDTGWRGGYGNLVKIEHDDNYMTLYGHLNKITVENGDTVKQGDVIGLMGSTGKSTGPHLHFEIHKDGVARNPLFFLP
jgi:murein DD-endopeptidase MepM/ murein hydrolase activator NlpD